MGQLTETAMKEARVLKKKVEADPRHLIYVVDEDAATKENDIPETIEWGPNCPKPLIDVIVQG
jgi:hypothetical protein